MKPLVPVEIIIELMVYKCFHLAVELDFVRVERWIDVEEVVMGFYNQ
jgi:hypothetical protein